MMTDPAKRLREEVAKQQDADDAVDFGGTGMVATPLEKAALDAANELERLLNVVDAAKEELPRYPYLFPKTRKALKVLGVEDAKI